ncbi:hypothetical protein LINGRAHAP2_LOCUS9290 [Linum grandiflorum]
MHPLANARQFDEGSSSRAGRQIPWHGRAINLVPPFEANREVICSYQQRLYFVAHKLAKSRRRKRKYLITIRRQSRVRAYTNIVARYDLLIRKLQAKAKCISTKIKLFISRSRPTNIGLPAVELFDLGLPMCFCQCCHAIMWREKSITATQNRQYPEFNMCCNGGKIRLPPALEPPTYLRELMISKHFHEYIRAYNGIFCFTSLGGKVTRELNDGSSVYIYSIGGQIFHRIGSLLPPEGSPPMFGQLYIYDIENEVENRMNCFSTDTSNNPLRSEIISGLRDMLDKHNALTKVYRSARDRINFGDVENVQIKLAATRPSYGREYALPAVNELAGLIVDEPAGGSYKPDVVVQYQTNKLERIDWNHASLMALQYPLLFPYGEDGWHGNTHISQSDFYAYRIQTRSRCKSHILLCGKLFQQYVVNAYALVEAERLEWMEKNQHKLRRHVFDGLVDAFNRGDTNLDHSGKGIILAASHTGSPRCKYENFQDAMAICRSIGYPDLFITFTCNAYWPEIQHMIDLLAESGHRDPNRADVMVRVFKLKLKQLMIEVKEKEIFGKCIGYVHAIEFQKRGLPHAHILVFLSAEDKI